MIKYKSKTFKGINADEKLTNFVTNVTHYMIGNYEGKVNTKDRKIQILYLME